MKMFFNNNLESKKSRGFTLVEVIGVLTIIGILCGISFIPLLGIIQNARMRAEREKLGIIAREIKASFQQDDLSYLNISSFYGEGPTNARLAIFDDATTTVFEEDAWYARLVRGRGVETTHLAGALDNLGGEVRELTFNAYGKRRILLAGPSEDGAQRYIILSCMFSGGPNIRVPYNRDDPDYVAWFNAIYNYDWGRAMEVPDGDWNAGAWESRASAGYTYLQKIVVQRVTQPRFHLTIQNSLTANLTGVMPDNLFCYTNILGDIMKLNNDNTPHYATWDTYPPQDGAALVPWFPQVLAPGGGLPVDDKGNIIRARGILEGRRVIVKRGPDTDTSREIYSFLINENTTITSQ